MADRWNPVSSLPDLPDLRLAFRFQPVPSAGGGAPEVVADQIVLAIRSGAFRAGDALPSARDLAHALEVSQGTVSSAVKLLQSYGLVKPSRGNQGGIRILRDDIPAGLLQLLSPRSDSWRRHAHNELAQARRAIEIPLAVLASESASPQDLSHMQSCLDEMTSARADGDMDAWIASDLRFHYSMGHAARSSVLARYQHEILMELALLIDIADDFADSRHVVTMHGELMTAMRSKDADAVRSAMIALIELSDCP